MEQGQNELKTSGEHGHATSEKSLNDTIPLRIRSTSYYRARYYDPATGRFLREDPARFDGGQNFYSYVTNNPVKRKDPLGLWQVTIGGGEGLGAMLTFGSNSGQWNFGLYTGGGEGAFVKVDMSDSGGCHAFGAHGGARADTEVGLGAGVTTDINVEEGSDPEVGVTAGIPNVIGVSVSVGLVFFESTRKRLFCLLASSLGYKNEE